METDKISSESKYTIIATTSIPVYRDKVMKDLLEDFKELEIFADAVPFAVGLRKNNFIHFFFLHLGLYTEDTERVLDLTDDDSRIDFINYLCYYQKEYYLGSVHAITKSIVAIDQDARKILTFSFI